MAALTRCSEWQNCHGCGPKAVATFVANPKQSLVSIMDLSSIRSLSLECAVPSRRDRPMDGPYLPRKP